MQGFLWDDQLRIVAELDGAGAVVSRFVYAEGVNVPEYMVKGGATYRIVTDHLGSPRLVVDVADRRCRPADRLRRVGPRAAGHQPGLPAVRLRGRPLDRDTRLVRFGARDYDAETGRWTSKDPIKFDGGDPNLYGYVVADPVNGFYPLGQLPWWLTPCPVCMLVELTVALVPSPGTVLLECAQKAPESKCGSCVCYGQGKGPNPKGSTDYSEGTPRPFTRESCQETCKTDGYSGYKCTGDKQPTWFN